MFNLTTLRILCIWNNVLMGQEKVANVPKSGCMDDFNFQELLQKRFLDNFYVLGWVYEFFFFKMELLNNAAIFFP